MEVEIEKNGNISKRGKGWNPKDLRFIIIKFEGKLNSIYKYPINSEDLVSKIVIKVEEKK